MKLALKVVLAVMMASISTTALACRLEGRVVCYQTGTPIVGAIVTVPGAEEPGVTDIDGKYLLWLPGCGDFTATLDVSAVDPAGSVVGPASVTFTTPDSDSPTIIDWVAAVAGCDAPKACWLTGGGAKFNPTLGFPVAERGPRVSFGGNVNPSCSPEPGEGGQWGHVDHDLKLHFQGTAIVVDDCGNVDGIPPGSTSPVTPYNYIEYHGTGRLTGIGGNKYPRTDVCFVARAEDRNEPGSTGQRDGAYKDRYFIRVFNCVTNQELLVLEQTAGVGDPITITDGNMQIHISSCTP
jgi:hypothetical protein